MAKLVAHPLYDRILVKRIPAEDITKGGIVIPEQAKTAPLEGYVTAVGEGRLTPDGKIVKLRITVGERILFGSYSGTHLRLEGEDYQLIREDDALIYFTGEEEIDA